MIIGCVSVFEEERFIRQCIRNLMDLPVERIIVVDGAYEAFPVLCGQSRDRTVEIAAEFPEVEIIECPAGRKWKDEIEKRNAYLVGKSGDWYLVNDGDELAEGRLPERLEGCGFNVPINHDGARTKYFRLFPHVAGLHYFGAHNLLFVGDQFINPAGFPAAPELSFLHRNRRDPDREMLQARYYAELVEKERPVREWYER